MGRYLVQSLASLFAQDYPNIQVLVRDGGSRDETIRLLEKYGTLLQWVSQPDGGPSHALRAGFAEARGSILAWLNADDLLEPRAVRRAVEIFESQPGLVAVYGEGVWIDEAGVVLGRYPTQDYTPGLLATDCFICQPACFFRAEAYRKAGGIDPGLSCSFDYDLWLRLSKLGPFLHVHEPFAQSRMYAANKSLRQRDVVYREGMKLLRRHYGYVPYHWVHSYTCYRIDGRDQFFQPIRPSRYTHLRSLPAGLWWNRGKPVRYMSEWLSHTMLRPLVARFSKSGYGRRG